MPQISTRDPGTARPAHEEAEQKGLHAFAPFFLIPMFVSGFGTVMESLTAGLLLVRGPQAAPILLTTVSGACVVALRRRGFRARREWFLIARAYLYDQVFSTALIWPHRAALVADPLGLYPYAMGTLATVIAAGFVGWVGRRRRMDYAIAFAAVDLLVAAVVWTSLGRGLTLGLVSRIAVAFAAATAGVYIGRLAREIVREKPAEMSAFGWNVLAGIISSVVGAALAAATIGQ